MLDKNGVEIKTGDVVKIEGAYFKNDNGFWYVENSDGDPNWCGKDHSLRKISKTGKISTASRNICFWPIMVCTNSWVKRIEAKTWNEEHATIEVVSGINRTEIGKHFEELAGNMDPEIERLEWNFGKESKCVTDQVNIQNHYREVAKTF
ncbi:hypothetical protein [Anaerocolumna xylanovorans]|uniref:Uncharacterized protein n=1 Tax=Anaerocolumna xylanovorans DSM 12503 TaxID=1121345 RepID=A0A1M7YBU1_9FIRM|nr:hypothetical protein [Anaerocolumna xylanovorans]SHO50046.1 hypothetical protein SAMN02745217_02546 [Anaerocolumna xylanovorans DSM 12503]